MILTNPIAIIFLRVVGAVHDQYGSYVPAFGGFIVMVVIAMVLIAMLKPNSDDAENPAAKEAELRVAN